MRKFTTKEVWADVPNRGEYYQVSSKGRIRFLEKISISGYGGKRYFPEKIITPNTDNGGYPVTQFRCGGNMRMHVHRLMYWAFYGILSDRKNVVDHINNIKTDNRLENLQLITQRENASKDKKSNTGVTGVHYCEGLKNPYRAMKFINGKNKTIGFYRSIEKATEAYKKFTI